MRYTQAEKLEIIRLVEESDLSVRRTLAQLQISRRSFYRWYRAYVEHGAEGLKPKPSSRRRFWNKIPDEQRQEVIELALARPDQSARELACHITDNKGWFVSESSVYRILRGEDLVTSPAYIVISAADEFRHKTRRVHQMWQTDFTYFKITGWGWYYLSTVLDDFSRYIISWSLRRSMCAVDVTETLDEALAVTGVEQIQVRHRPRLLSDNGPCYVSKDLREYLGEKGLTHSRGQPYHPQTQGKIERYHRTMKNVIKLRNYYQPEHLEHEISLFVDYYNHRRYHKALGDVTPADVLYGRRKQILQRRKEVRLQTINHRRDYNQGLRELVNAA